MASSPITSWEIDGETVSDLIFLGSKITADGDCSHEIKRRLLLGRKIMTKLDSILKSRDIYFANKGPSSQGYGFSSGHVWMWELGYKESWAPKNWCLWTVVLEKTLEPTPGVHSNSHPSSWWCHPTIPSSVVPFFSCLQSFPAPGSFPMSQFFTSGGQSIGVSASASVLPMNIQDWFPLGWTGLISLQSKGL